MQSILHKIKDMAARNQLLIFITLILVVAVGSITTFLFHYQLPVHQLAVYTYMIGSSALLVYLLYTFFQHKEMLKDSSVVTKQLKKQQDKNQRELEMARLIQQSLLGEHTFINKELKVLANCRPAEKIGGDFYTFAVQNSYNTLSKTNTQKGVIKLQNQVDRNLSVCIGDVAGHGIASALIMLLAKSLLDQLMQQFSSPAKIFQLANKKIKTHTEKSDISFVTASILVINLDTKMLCYSKAGHTDAILIRPDGTISLLTAEGVFLGMFDNADYEEKQLQLQPKDKIVLYTDGIIETRNPQGEIFGVKRFMNFLAANHHLPLEKIVSSVYEELYAYSHKHEVYDDSTLVLIEVL